MGTRRPVIVYLEDAPRRGGSGAHLRFFSNVRAWCDTGADVHLVRLLRPQDAPWDGDPDFRPASIHEYRVEAPAPRASIAARAAYRAGVPTRGAVDMYFPAARPAAAALRDMSARFPDALHVMEGEALAVGALHGRSDWIWSEHESLTESVVALQAAIPAPERVARRAALGRERRFVSSVERQLVRRASGIMYISERSRAAAAGRSSLPGAYVPLSVAADEALWARPSDDASRPLRLLHLGSVAHLPTFSSLRFLLAEVLPRLSDDAMQRVRLSVVGTYDLAHERCREIAALAGRFSNVEFHGFASALRPVYGEHDAQIIASTEAAGLRTRAIESLARGLPLIATGVAVAGVRHLQPHVHYAPLGDAAASARRLEALIRDRTALPRLAAAGRSLYDTEYSRGAVRDALMRAFHHLLVRG